MPSDKLDEIVMVVDETGNHLERVKRSELKDDHTWQIICIWIENSQGQVLLQQRSYQKAKGPGLWTCAVEGTVEGTDDFLETAEREIVEEIGLTEFELTPAKKVLYKSNTGSRLAQGYFVKCDWPIDKFVMQPEEVENLEWRDKKQTIQRMQDKDPDFPTTANVWLEMFDLV